MNQNIFPDMSITPTTNTHGKILLPDIDIDMGV
jgi:hypothetical protein